MALSYKIMGGDGNQYGPVVQPELQTWINEGRVTPVTRIQRSDQNDWQPANALPELRFQPPTDATPVSPAGTPQQFPERTQVETRIKSGASWFYWIAGLSLINSAVALSGSNWGFILGLGITQVIDAIAKGLGSAGVAVAMVLDVIVAGVFVLFGVFAHRKQSWSFIAGMVLYGLDGLLFLIGRDLPGLGFHAFALFCIFGGYSALRKLQEATER